MAARERTPMFGGNKGWNPIDWTSSDDRVRGGQSQSYLKINDDTATFCGQLDIDTLGGAGFASQRTTGDDRHWDFSSSTGIALSIDASKSDTKRYTFNLKDELLPRNPENGREQSTTSWEYDLDINQGKPHLTNANLLSIVIPWNQFTPTYRGKEKDPGRPINLADIRRISIMMRSFFGDQKGDFSLCLKSISLVGDDSDNTVDLKTTATLSTSSDTDSICQTKTVQEHTTAASPNSIWSKIFGLCNKL